MNEPPAALTYPCPACLVQADLVRGCPGCGRPPDPLAAEVVSLNTTIAVLQEREQRCLDELLAIRRELAETRARRDPLAMQVRTRTLLGVAASPSPSQSEPPAPLGAARPPGATMPGGAAVPTGPAVPPPAPAPPVPAGEVSGYGVQTLLFVIGGLLIGIGAVVFMVVAWTRFGLAGQALTLLLATALALTVPPLARWRRLPGTAETLAVIGVLMVLLDGYAAWRGGLAGELPAATWAGLTSGVTALVALGYGRWTKLASPRFAALVLAQPVLPLLAVEPIRTLPDRTYGLVVAGYLLAALAAGNLLLCQRLPGGSLRGLSWVAAGGALVTSAAAALLGLLVAPRVLPAALAGGAVVASVAAAALLARVSRAGAWSSVAAVAGVLALPLVVGKLVALAWPGYALLAMAGAVAALAVTGAVADVAPPLRRGPRSGAEPDQGSPSRPGRGPVRRGYQIGGAVAAGALGAYAAVLALWAGVVVAWQASELPAALEVTGPYGWQLLAALGLLAIAGAALLPAARPEVGTGAVALLAFAGPAALSLPWWTPVVAGLAAAVVIAPPAARAAASRRAYPALAVAAGLATYAVLAGTASAVTLAAALGGVVGLGLAVAARAWPLTAAPPGEPAGAGQPRHRTVAGCAALLTGLLAVPGAVAAGAVAIAATDPWPARAALAAAGLLLGAVLLLRYAAPAASYLATAAGAVHVVTPVAVIAGLFEGGLAVAAHAGVALVLLSGLGLLRPPASPGWWLLPRAPLAGLLLILLLPSLAQVMLAPYAWLGSVWAGRPAGTGLLAPGQLALPGSVLDPATSGGPLVAGLILLLLAAGLAGLVVAGAADRTGVAAPAPAGPAEPAAGRPGRAGSGRWQGARRATLLVAPPALLVGLAWLAAPWPLIPAVSLLLGGLALGWTAMRLPGPWVPVGTGYGLVLAGAGLAGALPLPWTTLAGLGFVLVVAAVAAGAASRVPARAAGWVAASGAGVLLAIAATRAAAAPAAVTGFAVLGVAAVVLAGSALAPRHRQGAAEPPGGQLETMASRGRAELAAAEASAHAGAVVALLLLLSSPGQAAVVAVLWGVALAIRALRRGEPAGGRVARLIAAGGSQLLAWWLLLVSVGAELVEAYTLPAALLALAAGAWVRRSRPSLSSWAAYGPGLAAALLPSLALTLADPMPLRRLLLGLGAVAVLMAGARVRLQAPVVIGGALAGLLALRELALVWQRLDAWIPLTVAGLLLVGLAATYERRRRDLARLRAALRQMG